MLCLVQSFQQAKAAEAKSKSSKLRKLPFFRRKKSSISDNQDEKNLLHPDMAKGTSGAFWHKDKQSHKLSGSAPSVTCPSLDVSLTPSTCHSHQKKFLRHFKVDPEEKIIDYFSCALVADILLQGHLYISKNYFAFYSNVFGYVTRLLIPTSSVITVTKEKTAYILPNAVGVTTADDKHVFSSLLSRDTTFRLMVQIWRSSYTSAIPNAISAPEVDVEGSLGEESSTQSGSESMFDTKSITTPQVPNVEEDKKISQQPKHIAPPTECHHSLPRSTLLLTASTTLLIVLFFSVSVLMYRVSQLQHSQSTHHSRSSKSLYDFQEFLDANLNNLYKVRQSLEALSLIIDNEKEKVSWKIKINNDLEESKPIKRGTTPSKSEAPQQMKESITS